MLQTLSITQPVFIVGGDTLFEECISQLLTSRTSLQALSIKYTNELALLDHIALHQPQVIILNESVLLSPIFLLELLFTTHWLRGIRVIFVRDTDAMMDVYDFSQQTNIRILCERQQYLLSKQNDLLAVVQG